MVCKALENDGYSRVPSSSRARNARPAVLIQADCGVWRRILADPK
jgi:hypothetical protein